MGRLSSSSIVHQVEAGEEPKIWMSEVSPVAEILKQGMEGVNSSNVLLHQVVVHVPALEGGIHPGAEEQGIPKSQLLQHNKIMHHWSVVVIVKHQVVAVSRWVF